VRLIWVIGAGGMLGSSLLRATSLNGASFFAPGERFAWLDATTLNRQISRAVVQFSEQVTRDASWEIYWAAGIGNMGSESAALSAETYALKALLDAIACDSNLQNCPGSLAFASSAGAIYAGCPDDTITEFSNPMPTTAYGFEKLKQESLLLDFNSRESSHKLLIARISTLFGPRQPGRSTKGLFSILARSMFRADAARVFVPLDTMRNYIYSDEAASALVAAIRAMPHASSPLIKIVAAQQSTTIAEIVATFKRVGHKHPRIITGTTALSAKYSGRAQYRSIVGPEVAATNQLPLHVCVAHILEAERMAYVQPNQQ
jgi:UDP-glucose 4-epimerase